MQTFKYANFRELLALQESFVYRPAPTACVYLPEIHRVKTKLAPIRTITTTKNQQVLVQLGWAAKACPVPRACAISLCIARAPAASSSVPSGAAARSGQDSLSLLRPTSILPRSSFWCCALNVHAYTPWGKPPSILGGLFPPAQLAAVEKVDGLALP